MSRLRQCCEVAGEAAGADRHRRWPGHRRDRSSSRPATHQQGGRAAASDTVAGNRGGPTAGPLEAFLVAAQLNALQRHHQSHLVEIARILNAMTPEQHASFGIREWDPAEAYDRVER